MRIKLFGGVTRTTHGYVALRRQTSISHHASLVCTYIAGQVTVVLICGSYIECLYRSDEALTKPT